MSAREHHDHSHRHNHHHGDHHRHSNHHSHGDHHRDGHSGIQVIGDCSGDFLLGSLRCLQEIGCLVKIAVELG